VFKKQIPGQTLYKVPYIWIGRPKPFGMNRLARSGFLALPPEGFTGQEAVSFFLNIGGARADKLRRKWPVPLGLGRVVVFQRTVGKNEHCVLTKKNVQNIKQPIAALCGTTGTASGLCFTKGEGIMSSSCANDGSHRAKERSDHE